MRTAAILVALGGCAVWAADCARTSVGLKPLTEPFFTSYQGMPGGLYPGGRNLRPDAHQAAGRTLAAAVTPLNAAGAPDAQNGLIVLLSIGMSNTSQEFSTFQALAGRDPELNPKLAMVDGAQDGWTADRIVAAGGEQYWQVVEARLSAAGASGAQVQAVWLKEADASPGKPFPANAQQLQDELQTIAQTLRVRYPNLKLLYLSSRIYAGYATSGLNPEPDAYESGFAVKGLIEAQIQGSPDLSYTGGKAPWMAWGPYLWADGTRQRSDGLTWVCSDLESDGTHPAPAGQQKVARMLLDLFKIDTTARPWFVRPAGVVVEPAAAAIRNAASFASQVAPGAIATIFGSSFSSTTAAASALPLPPGLAGTSVTVGGEPAPVYFVSPTQINVLVPAGIGDASVVVTREGQLSQPIPASLALNTPGLFTLDGSGSGAAAALHNGDYSTVTPGNPAARGESIALFATGRGVRNPAIMSPELLPRVTIGGAAAPVSYWGPAPGWPGMDQINVTVPADAPSGAAVAVQLSLGSFSANLATLAVR